MELTAEQITELGLNDEQVPKISSFLADTQANLKKTYDEEYSGKANENAEGILDGALNKVIQDTSIDRIKGEKVGDYIQRAWSEFNSSKLSELSKTKSEYEEKVKGFKGNEDLISKISNLESENDSLLQKYANYDELSKKAELYDPLNEKYNATKKEIAFNSIKPTFPTDANKYEVEYKWKSFRDNVLEKYNLEIVDGEPKAIDKENKHRILNLSDLLGKDEGLNELLKGRQQNGIGAKEVSIKEIAEVPFPVTDSAKTDSKERADLIRAYLDSKGLDKINDSEYSVLFAKYNSLIRKG